MSPKFIFATAAIAVTAFASLPASAQEAAPSAPANPPAAAEAAPPAERPVPFRIQILFNLVDVNADGAIDQTEIAALQRAIFTAADVDADGKITQAEFAKVIAGPGDRARHAARMMRGGNNDRARTFMFRHGPGMKHDGGPRGERGDHRRGPDGRRSELAPQPGAGPETQLGDVLIPAPFETEEFAALDLNGDGAVTIDEFDAAGPALPGLPR